MMTDGTGKTDRKEGRPGRTIVVLALSRMGDLYQLYPTILALREESPDDRIFLVIYREFAQALEPLAAFDGIFPVDGASLKRRILSGEDPVSLYRMTAGILGAINNLDIDLLINLTPNRIGAMIGYLIRAREKRGLSMTRDGYRIHQSPWILYLSMFVKNRLYNDLNLVDLFKNIAGAGPVRDPGRPRKELSREALGRADDLLAEWGISPGDPVVAMATGASVEIKRWPVTSFSEVVRDLLIAHPRMRILLLGSGAEDGERNRQIVQAVSTSGAVAGRIVDLTGRTPVASLAALLTRVDLLLSNDTGTMHVAAVFGTPSVCLSFSQLFYPETAPVLTGNVVVSSLRACAPCAPSALCNNPVCREDLSPAFVARVIRTRLEAARQPDGWSWDNLEKGLAALWVPSGVQVALCRMNHRGEAEFVACGGQKDDPGSILRPVYRALWREVLGRGQKDDSVRIVWPESQGGWARDWDLSLATLKVQAEAGISLVRQCLSGGRVDPDLAFRLESVDRVIRLTGEVFPPVSPLSTMFSLEKESIGVRDPLEWRLLVEETQKTYERLLERVLWLDSCREEGGSLLLPGGQTTGRCPEHYADHPVITGS